MSLAEQMWNCVPATRAAFQAAVTGLRYAFCSIELTDGGRLVVVRAGDEHGPLVGYREDYANETFFHVARRLYE